MGFDLDLDAVLAILGPILVVAIGAAVVKKAVGIAITLIAILLIGSLILKALGMM